MGQPPLGHRTGFPGSGSTKNHGLSHSTNIQEVSLPLGRMKSVSTTVCMQMGGARPAGVLCPVPYWAPPGEHG